MKVFSKILYLCKMKRLFSYGLLIVVLIVYVTTTVGFGIHVCQTDGSREAMLLTGGPCCDHSQMPNHHLAHSQCCASSEHAAAEACAASAGLPCCAEEKCCELSVYVLGADQDVVSNVSASAPAIACLAALSNEMGGVLSGPRTEAIYWSDPPPLLASPAYLLPLRL